MEDAAALQRPQSERKATHEAGPYEQAATQPQTSKRSCLKSDGSEQSRRTVRRAAGGPAIARRPTRD